MPQFKSFDEVPEKRHAVRQAELQQPRGGRIVADHRGGIALLDAAFEPAQDWRSTLLTWIGKVCEASPDHVLVILDESLGSSSTRQIDALVVVEAVLDGGEPGRKRGRELARTWRIRVRTALGSGPMNEISASGGCTTRRRGYRAA